MDDAAQRRRRSSRPRLAHPSGAAAAREARSARRSTVCGASAGLHPAGQQLVGFVTTPVAAAGAWHVERLSEAAVHRHDQALSSAPSVHWRDVNAQRSSNSARSFTTLIEMLHDAASSGTAGMAGNAGGTAGAGASGTSGAGAGEAGIAGAEGAAGAGATVPVSLSGSGEESDPPQAGTRTRASATQRSLRFMETQTTRPRGSDTAPRPVRRPKGIPAQSSHANAAGFELGNGVRRLAVAHERALRERTPRGR